MVDATKRELKYTEWKQKASLIPRDVAEAVELLGNGGDCSADDGTILPMILDTCGMNTSCRLTSATTKKANQMAKIAGRTTFVEG